MSGTPRGPVPPHHVPEGKMVRKLRRLFGDRALGVARDFERDSKVDFVRAYWTRVIAALEDK